MLVMLAGEKLISPQTVCPGCLFADQAGNPRWRNGVLQCGRPNMNAPRSLSDRQFECPMGFRLIEIER